MTLNLDPLARPVWRGRTNVDQITAAAVEYAETLRRHPGAQFICTQGSYQGGNGDPLSAGTHDLGGVVDLRWTGDDHDVWALRAAGFAAWHRTPAMGPWPDHIHAVLIGHPYLAASAQRQVESYRAGRNGLANNGPDDGPRIDPIPTFHWPQEADMPLNDADLAAIDALIVKRIAEAADTIKVDVGDGKPKLSLGTILRSTWKRSKA